MRNRIYLVLALLLVVTVFACAGGRPEQTDDQVAEEAVSADSAQAGEPAGTPIGTSDPQRVIATVNGVGILRADFETAVAQTLQSFQMQGQFVGDDELEVFRSDVLDQLIAEELLYQAALRQSLTVSEQSVASQFQQIRAQFDTAERWQEALEANDTSESELREQIRRNDLIQQLMMTALADTAEVTEAEVRRFYDENPQFFDQGEQIAARHIIVSTQGMTSDEEIAAARGRMEDIRRQIVEGGDFAELAREYSEDGSAAQGGDLGSFGRGMMVPEFEAVAFALEPGEISEVVRTQFGFHVVEVTEKLDSGLIPIDQVSGSIRQYLGQQRQADAIEDYVDQLRDEATIVIEG